MLNEAINAKSVLKGLKNITWGLLINTIRTLLGKKDVNTLDPDKAHEYFNKPENYKGVKGSIQQNGEMMFRFWYPVGEPIQDDQTKLKTFPKWESLPLFVVVSRRMASQNFDENAGVFKPTNQTIKLGKIGIYIGIKDTKDDENKSIKKTIKPSRYTSDVSSKVLDAISGWKKLQTVLSDNMSTVADDDFKQIMVKAKKSKASNNEKRDIDMHSVGGIMSFHNMFWDTFTEIEAPYKKEVDAVNKSINMLINHLQKCDASMKARIQGYSNLSKQLGTKEDEDPTKKQDLDAEIQDKENKEAKEAEEKEKSEKENPKPTEAELKKESVAESIVNAILLEKSEDHETLDTDLENKRDELDIRGGTASDENSSAVLMVYSYLKWFNLNFEWQTAYSKLDITETEMDISKKGTVSATNNQTISISALFNAFGGAQIMNTVKHNNELMKANAFNGTFEFDDGSPKEGDEGNELLTKLGEADVGAVYRFKDDENELEFTKTDEGWEFTKNSVTELVPFLNKIYSFTAEDGQDGLRVLGHDFPHDYFDFPNAIMTKVETEEETEPKDGQDEPKDGEEETENSDDETEVEKTEEDTSSNIETTLSFIEDKEFDLPIEIDFDTEDDRENALISLIKTRPTLTDIKRIVDTLDSAEDEAKPFYENIIVQLVAIRFYYAYKLKDESESIEDFGVRIGSDELAQAMVSEEADDDIKIICDLLGFEMTPKMISAWEKNQLIVPTKDFDKSEEFDKKFFVESKDYNFMDYLTL